MSDFRPLPVHFLTIVLDGMPWITHHYWMMRQLPFPWTWHVVEGVAAPENCTAWCKRMEPRLSDDGTTDFLKSLSFDSRVKLYQKPEWRGKIEMVNTPLATITEPCLLWEVDSDEIWTGKQVATMRQMFIQNPSKLDAQFFCRYFVGPDIITTAINAYGNRPNEWMRVWRFNPGDRFVSHEPPLLRLKTPKEGRFFREQTAAAGLVFDHFAYATEKTVALKEKYYGRENGLYSNAVGDWRRLQENQQWPIKLKDFLPWVDDRALAIRL